MEESGDSERRGGPSQVVGFVWDQAQLPDADPPDLCCICSGGVVAVVLLFEPHLSLRFS